MRPDSKATKFGGKPGGKKPYKPFNSAEKKSNPWKTGDNGKKPNRFIDGESQKRKKPPLKSKRGQEAEGGFTLPSRTFEISPSPIDMHYLILTGV